jgi:glycosyltransferase involved in cell wall biosynthesis
MSSPALGVRHVAVVVPAHDEEELLPRCLAALAAAAREIVLPVSVVVVADSCSDSTEQLARSFDPRAFAELSVLSCGHRSVGAARDLGVRVLIDRCGVDGLWLATTDADSAVPVGWFSGQLAHAGRGADAVIGTVDVSDWSAHPPAVHRRYAAHYRSVAGHRHTHGANLSFTARVYRAVGGFPAVSSDEDVALVQRLGAAGAAVVWAADIPVTTSSRLHGRAPHGFAGFLARLADSAPESTAGTATDELTELVTDVAT